MSMKHKCDTHAWQSETVPYLACSNQNGADINGYAKLVADRLRGVER